MKRALSGEYVDQRGVGMRELLCGWVVEEHVD